MSAMTIAIITGSILSATAMLDLIKVFFRDLMMLQQNSYRNERYMKWFSQSGESTSIGRIFCCIGMLFLMVHHLPFLREP